MKRRTALMPLAVAAALLASPASATSSVSTDEVPAVTAGQLARSVTTYSTLRTVTVYSLDRRVTVLEQREQEGTRTTVTLSSDVLFAFASADVDETAAARLRSLAAEVPAGATLSIVGHTDDVGDDAVNDALSLQRAEAVAAVVRAAAPGLAVTTDGRGKREPVVRGTEPEDRAANRRVVLSYEA